MSLANEFIQNPWDSPFHETRLSAIKLRIRWPGYPYGDSVYAIHVKCQDEIRRETQMTLTRCEIARAIARLYQSFLQHCREEPWVVEDPRYPFDPKRLYLVSLENIYGDMFQAVINVDP
ncbi:hypothetical protein A0H81_04999 [Grifola frondosa]|uniref:Uncharacterized protein n=1 Tax=Grifola frondosa TaxID=5627 RepID=A0A1C7MFT9_GRIFR|nr:hypothetical protein A0H81_04999 [Grifola frondosa]